MIELASPKSCTACQACVNVCPKHAISMCPDKEGFLQPVINREECIECGSCQRKCPALNDLRFMPKEQRAYALISNQDRTLSSSGGAFSVFSRIVLNCGGIVYGAILDDDLQCRHVGVENVEDLAKLRGSKYIQSDIGLVYSKIKNNLLNNKKVLFSGTPCQVAGLYSFLGRRYEDLLITLDLICHGVPNQKSFDSYIKKLRKSDGVEYSDFLFRKLDSWSHISSAKNETGKWKNLYLWKNAYMNAFFQGVTFRECCFNCNYCNLNRQGTFTIADFWGVGGHAPFRKNIAKGVSLVIDNCGKMSELIQEVKKIAYIEERTLAEAVEKQYNLKKPMERLPARDFAISLLMDENVDLEKFSMQCGLPYKKNLKNVLVLLVKKIIDMFGLYNVYKTISYKLGKRS